MKVPTDLENIKIAITDSLMLKGWKVKDIKIDSQDSNIISISFDAKPPGNVLVNFSNELLGIGTCDHDWRHYEGDFMEHCHKCNAEQRAAK